MKRLLKEPLLHFLLLGAAIFAIYGFVNRRVINEPGTIVITQGQIESIVTVFARAGQRPPTTNELAALINERVREEVYAREAMALGLDKDHTVIRRRLRQKMEFVSDDIADAAEPTDAELEAYLQMHAKAFAVGEQLTFHQIFLNPEKHGEKLADDAVLLLAQLNQSHGNPDLSTLGDPFMLENEFVGEPVSEVAKQFGDAFAAKLEEFPLGQWQGPVQSGFGAHLIQVSERTEGRLPVLAEVREAVRRDWSNAKRKEMNERIYQTMVRRYAVSIEQPKGPAEPKKVAESK